VQSSATRRALGALLAGSVVAAAAWSRAQPIDPTLPQQRIVGRPSAPASMMRLTPGRTGRSRSPLPLAPRVLWRTRAQGGIAHSVSVDARGAIVIASSIAQIVQIDPHGKPEWTVHTGRGAPLTTPVITSDGTRVVVVPGPQLVGVDATGHVRFKRALPASGSSASFVAAPLPLDSGGVALSLGSTMIRVDPAGHVVSMADAPETVQALLGRSGSLLAVTRRGNVLSWRSPDAPSRVGSFGEQVDGWPALCSSHSICASVGHHRLVELDLDNGIRHVRLDDPSILLLGSPAISRTRETLTPTEDGLVLGHDARGKETLRVALIPGSLSPDGGALPSLVRRTTLPPVIVDSAGTLAFARPGLDAGIVTPAGDLHTAPGTACADPVGVAPAGSHRMVVACRSGLLWLLGDKAKR
jgi:hypothetical protein